MKAYVFPGQGAQFTGMGKELYEQNETAKQLFHRANDILGFDIIHIMFNGSEEELKQTRVTQPAVFLHSVILAATLPDFKPDAVAGHSLGEFSSLVANKTLSFEDALQLVYLRASAMQRACEMNPSTMAAVLGADDKLVEDICGSINDDIVVPANYNTLGQLVISGSMSGIDKAIEKLSASGIRKVIKLNVGGAFHSPLMEPAREELAAAIEKTHFSKAICPVYQNVHAQAVTNEDEIKKNLVAQLTKPVRWTQTIQNMLAAGINSFVEVGPGNVLCGLIKKVDRNVETMKA